MSTNPLASIIVPTFNRAKFLPRCIHSILNQTYTNFELIIVDDGSTDNTRDVVTSFDDKRIRYLAQDKNRGAAYARNVGIRAAYGIYIGFQDSDDEWFPNNLEKKITAIINSPASVGVVYSKFIKIGKDKKRTVWPPEWIKKLDGNLHKELLRGNFITGQAVLIKREVFDAVGLYEESLPGFQEWELWLRIAKKYMFQFIPEPLLVTYYSEDSITAHPSWRLRGREIILEKHWGEFAHYPRILAMHAFTIGNALALRGEMKRARRYLIRAWIRETWNPKYLVALLASTVGSKRLYRIFASYHKYL